MTRIYQLITLAVVSTLAIFTFFAFTGCSGNEYSEGMHWDYNIHCENGFVYKTLNNRKGTIQVLNSDGTPLHCGSKIY
jgi:hypothetical protein